MEDAYNAVDSALNCEEDPTGDPIVPMGDVQLTSEQKLCAASVQVDLYPNQESLDEAYDLWRTSSQGSVHIVRGANWMVVDTTRVQPVSGGTTQASGGTTQWDLKGLADKLNGEYNEVGS